MADLAWAREFFTNPRFSPATAINIYGNCRDEDYLSNGRVRYFLGAAVREYTRGEG